MYMHHARNFSLSYKVGLGTCVTIDMTLLLCGSTDGFVNSLLISMNVLPLSG